MKAVILAGGMGTRISEESNRMPKPMIPIGEHPILWHIMKIYSHFGINEFIICLGYKGNVIKDYFANYYYYASDVTFDFSDGNGMTIHSNVSEPWKVTLVDTGLNTQTGGRLKRIENYIDGTFCMTYGDGVSDVNLNALLDYHRKKNVMATLTAVQPGGRYGVLELNKDNNVKRFREKVSDGGWINAGFMVLEPEVLNYIEGDDTVFEREPICNIAGEGNLSAFKHCGFWQCMDTQRDKLLLEDLWNNQPPWKVWE